MAVPAVLQQHPQLTLCMQHRVCRTPTTGLVPQSSEKQRLPGGVDKGLHHPWYTYRRADARHMHGDAQGV
jgi:hypothetical protein